MNSLGAPQFSAPLPGTGKKVPGWDRPVALGLLVAGLLGTFFAVAMLQSVPDAVQMLYTQEDLGHYTPAASVAGLITAGQVTVWAVWAITVGLTVLLTTRHRRAFYVPLIGAVVSFVAIFVFLTVILTTDPTLLNFYSRP